LLTDLGQIACSVAGSFAPRTFYIGAMKIDQSHVLAPAKSNEIATDSNANSGAILG
jgi:hypothetical protein